MGADMDYEIRDSFLKQAISRAQAFEASVDGLSEEERDEEILQNIDNSVTGYLLFPGENGRTEYAVIDGGATPDGSGNVTVFSALFPSKDAVLEFIKRNRMEDVL